MYRCLLSILVFVGAWLWAGPATAAKPAGEHINVIVVLLDDAGYADFGFNGGRQIQTPHMDALAASGVRFTRAYVSAAVCCPSRAGLLTGRYQQRFGHESNGPGKPLPGWTQADMGLAPEEKTLGDAFRAHGYKTQIVGKWHMGGQPQFFPLERGFDEYFGLEAGHRRYFTHPPYEQPNRVKFRMHRDRELVPEDEITYLTDDQTYAALDFINRHRDKPFFIYLSYTAVHAPIEAKPVDLAVYVDIQEPRRRGYAAMMKSVDDNIGRLRDTLERNGLTERTLVILTNDNGGPTDANASDNGPLRSGKGSNFEGGIRVPMVLSLPGRVKAGSTYGHPVSTLDILPTALGAAGLEYPFEQALDGADLMPYLSGQAPGPPHDALYWKRGKVAAISEGDWKLITVVDGPDVLVNLADDPRETANLALLMPEQTAAMKAKLQAWLDEHIAPRWDEGERWIEGRRRDHLMDPIQPDGPGQISYRLSDGWEDWPADKRDAITHAMDVAVAIYNQHTSLKKDLRVTYNPDVRTADANYNGHIRFGGSISSRTALHEISHTVGVGTTKAWKERIEGGTWPGKSATSLVREYNGEEARLNGDAKHFWPYGLNFPREDGEVERVRHVKMVEAICRDMGLPVFVPDNE